MDKKHILIVGAGPGGLTSAMILAHRGFKVTVLEQDPVVGGRNQPIKMGGFTFDTGPTFLMMSFILEDMFEETGRKASDYMKFERLDPMYNLKFPDMEITPSDNEDKMRAEIKRLFPGDEQGLKRFMDEEGKRYEKLFPCLQKDYSTWTEMFCKQLRAAFPYLALDRSFFQNLGRYFSKDRLKLSFTFQSKYIGMSPWECPGLFTMISYIEHKYGIYHVMGGLNKISEAMAKVAREEGADIRLNTKARKLIIEGRTVKGAELESGERILADETIVNADFAYAMSHIVEPGILRKYSPEKLAKRDYSCSTFMLYLGLKKKYNLQHHTVIFSENYREFVDSIFHSKKLFPDISFYVQNASRTDPSLAPEGKSTIYVLVPVPNNMGGVDWDKEKPAFRERVLKLMEQRTEMKDIRQQIEVEKIITPKDWEGSHSVYAGATFNLSHKIMQMLYFRPRNKFEELNNCYLTGGGTHPGSGLPTIYESARISANLISRKYGVPFKAPTTLDAKHSV